MADFCKQCSEELFGEDFQDLAGLLIKEEISKELYALMICEGCGSIQVNYLGECVSEDCLKKGHPEYEK